MTLQDKTAVVTGAAHGIGEALARRLAACGAGRVVLVDIDSEGVSRVAEEVGGLARVVDVCAPEQVACLIGEIQTEFGAIDYCFSNAGVAVGGGLETEVEDWCRAWEVNALAHVHLARLVIPGMASRGEGRFVITASAAGLVSNVTAGPYAVAKASAVAFAEWLAINYGDSGVKVSCLCPQGVDTRMLEADDPLMAFLRKGALSPDQVVDAVFRGLEANQFLILPHHEVADYFRRKAGDYDRWLEGMRRFRRSLSTRRDDHETIRNENVKG